MIEDLVGRKPHCKYYVQNSLHDRGNSPYPMVAEVVIRYMSGELYIANLYVKTSELSCIACHYALMKGATAC